MTKSSANRGGWRSGGAALEARAFAKAGPVFFANEAGLPATNNRAARRQLAKIQKKAQSKK
jgi:hypothetical protein